MSVQAHKPLGGPLFTPMFCVLGVIAAIGFYFIGVRYVEGLGAVTNLNPGYPWGIWVVVDIVIGTAFGCGGFAMALLVYVFNRSAYHPLMRPALLGGLFGYTLGAFAVMIDLGRYWQAYNLLLPWYAQPNSVMFEVALCVMAYVAVLWIEFAPAFFERFGLTGLRERLRKVMFVFVGLGILLPTMHQSSLGSVLLVMGSQISPLWYTTWLPLLYLITALAMGYAIVIFEAVLLSETYGTPSEQPILAKLSKVVAVLVAGFLVIRFADLAVQGVLGFAFDGSLEAAMFWTENALFVLALVLLGTEAGRSSARGLFVAGAALLVAGSMYRIDSYLVAYTPPQNWSYFPSVPELMVTIGVISLEIMLYMLFVKKLPVLSTLHGPETELQTR